MAAAMAAAGAAAVFYSQFQWPCWQRQHYSLKRAAASKQASRQAEQVFVVETTPALASA
jgi:hypothetical protein